MGPVQAMLLNALDTSSPEYLNNIVRFVAASRYHPDLRSRRSALSTDYVLPRLRTKFGERAFSHAGPSAWNALPEDIRAISDSAIFLEISLRLIILA